MLHLYTDKDLLKSFDVILARDTWKSMNNLFQTNKRIDAKLNEEE